MKVTILSRDMMPIVGGTTDGQFVLHIYEDGSGEQSQVVMDAEQMLHLCKMFVGFSTKHKLFGEGTYIGDTLKTINTLMKNF